MLVRYKFNRIANLSSRYAVRDLKQYEYRDFSVVALCRNDIDSENSRELLITIRSDIPVNR